MSDVIKKATRESYGEALAELSEKYEKLVVLDADLAAATKTGIFKKENSIYLDDILNEDFSKYIISPLQVFESFDKINIDEKTYRDLLNGKMITYKGLNKDTFVLFNNKLIGVAKSNSEYLKLSTYLEE